MDYKEKLQEAKRLYETANVDQRYVLESLFPELKESEDERIRESLIEYFESHHNDTVFCGSTVIDILAWLEKQGEQKPFDYEKAHIQQNEFVPKSALEAIKVEKVDNQNCIKSDDKVEPKFHEGEWITNGDYTWQIVSVTDLGYILQSQDGNTVDDTISHVDEQFHSFTIQDTKDGDIIYAKHKFDVGSYIRIFHKLEDEKCWGYCNVYSEGLKFWEFNDDRGFLRLDRYDFYPATKEQRDLLIQKMEKAGYTFDFKKKELRKIEHNPAWSEEDESYRNAIISLIQEIKSQKLKRLENWDNYINWLKSLRPQKQWKPNEEQMDCLKEAADNYPNPDVTETLYEIYRQLKNIL